MTTPTGTLRCRYLAEKLEDRSLPAGFLESIDLFEFQRPDSIGEAVEVDGVLYFHGTTLDEGAELWRYLPTLDRYELVADIQDGSLSGLPEKLTNVDGTLYFIADDGTSGVELWRSDGTTSGTFRVKDIGPGADDGLTRYSQFFDTILANVDGKLFFQANDGSRGLELWTSDGTESGTLLVKEVVVGSPNGVPRNLINVNGTLFFTGLTNYFSPA
ncbi:MAG: ELWxxDGT repeat protein [Planctomycetia bacterium]